MYIFLGCFLGEVGARGGVSGLGIFDSFLLLLLLSLFIHVGNREYDDCIYQWLHGKFPALGGKSPSWVTRYDLL
jgi:hypothetical protein